MQNWQKISRLSRHSRFRTVTCPVITCMPCPVLFPRVKSKYAKCRASKQGSRGRRKSSLLRDRGLFMKYAQKSNGNFLNVAHSAEESLHGSHLMTDSWEEPLKDSELQGSIEQACETNAQEPEVLRSLWDLKIPEIDEKQQTGKMLQVLGATAIAAVISNMDKVNMSVAIVPMMAAFGWSKTAVGILQASFFWGYLMAQIPSGQMVSRFGGRSVLAVGVLLWSLSTCAAPLCAYASITLLCVTRFLVGFFEATAPSANADLITRWAAVEDRSRAVTAVWAGFNVGNVLGLLAAPICVSLFGWESIFYIFGSIGLVWFLAWSVINRGTPLPCKTAVSRFEYVRVGEASTTNADKNLKSRREPDNDPIPYRAFFRVPAFWAMNTVHFCENWGKFTLMAWLPVYYRSTLGLSLQACSVLCILPYLLGVVISTVGASVADGLIRRGWSLTAVRKMMQCTASGGAGAFMAATVFATSPTAQVACLTGALAVANLSTVGLYCSHQDISPKYAGVMLSITNTFGSVPGVVGNFLVGALMDVTGSWTVSLIIPCVACYAISALSWATLYSSDPVDFDSMSDRDQQPAAASWKAA